MGAVILSNNHTRIVESKFERKDRIEASRTNTYHRLSNSNEVK